ncbi:NIPA-like protein isoform X2 [Acanthaster planci]|uniref:NIPA-like protein isoform X2 n=1 Tax=Acanthaster planci TaxID=133434 RepID=A0A8B7ZNS5_ACAPL|nr:NIPA-like protein isoform X2 [Acanthaster planci]
MIIFKMAEKRKLPSASSGAKRIKALFSSFIRKETNNETKAESSLESGDPEVKIDGTEGQVTGDTIDGAVSGSKPETPSRRSFRPLNIEDFFGRVETFTAFGWFAKPSDLSPLHCARHGWENINADCLKCVSCREILCGGLPVMWETDSYAQAYGKLKDSLKIAHSKICPWPDSPSPESFLHIPLGDVKSAVESFYSRLDTMHLLGVSLPSIDCSIIKEEFVIDEVEPALLKLIAEREDSAIIVSEEEKPIWLTVCLLAVFGWLKSHTEQTGCPVLVCQYCRRHAGLWNFISLKEAEAKPAIINEASSTDTERQESPTDRIKDIEKSAFNPATEHRSWCPWIQPSAFQPLRLQRTSNELTQSDDKPIAKLSWQQLLIILLKRTDPQTYGALAPVINKETTPPSQTWKAVRRILNIWQSKETAPPPNATTDPPKDSS